MSFKDRIRLYNVLMNKLKYCKEAILKNCKCLKYSNGAQFWAAASAINVVCALLNIIGMTHFYYVDLLRLGHIRLEIFSAADDFSRSHDVRRALGMGTGGPGERLIMNPSFVSLRNFGINIFVVSNALVIFILIFLGVILRRIGR